MNAVPVRLPLFLAVLASAAGASLSFNLLAADVAERTVDFAREVRPILSENCFSCHGPDGEARQRGLRFDVQEGPFGDRGEFGGPVIVAGNAAESLLIHRITDSNPGIRMPWTWASGGWVIPDMDNDAALTDVEVETLRLWIDQGAEWQSHWSFIAPERSAPPTVADSEWLRNPIDNFVLSRLEQEGMSPSPEADLPTLIRRVTLDLTGLPPTQAEITAVLGDDSPDAYENHVDRLLQSSGYGERMAAEWLDGARYADSSGYLGDAKRSMWRWRDWVIGAYNDNMPFDQFTTEQIAGDLLPDATLDQRIATGFNRNHPQNAEGGIIEAEFLVENAIDRVETTGTVWLGLTLGCARCHDHKFDPITRSEFYQITGYFNNISERGKAFKYGNSPPMVTAPTTEQFAELAELDAEISEAREAFASLESEATHAQKQWEDSLLEAGSVDWILRDKLLAHYPLDGDIAGVFTGEPLIHRDLEVGDQGLPTFVRTSEPETVTFPVQVTLKDGQPHFVRGPLGEAVSFDGQRFIDAGNIANFIYDDPWTLSAWINPTAADGVIVSRARIGDDGEQGWGLSLAEGKVQVNMSYRFLEDGLRVETRDALPLDEWQHVLVTYDGNRVPAGFQVYVNGQPQALTTLLDGINNDIRVDEPLRIGAIGAVQVAGSRPRFQGQIDDVRIYMAALTPVQAAVVATGESLSEIAKFTPANRTAGQSEKLRLAFLDQYAAKPIQEAFRQVTDLERQRAKLWDSFPTVMVMEEMESRRQTFDLLRGVYDDHGEQVSPGVPAALPPLPVNQENNRLAFARWLVNPEHPLTSRVTVNRFWQMYFGTGLVKSTENFGLQGEFPSHPELLDWLAMTFVDSGWDVKAMQRSIVTSATYRQSSVTTPALLEQDPENRLLARGSRYRLPAQMIRDQALSLGGLLVDRVGGPPVYPYQPEGLWAQAGESYPQSEGEDLYRRSLYTNWRRTLGPPEMLAFDHATRETSSVRLQQTNTPLQALTLMNDVTYVEAARGLAQRMMTEGGSTLEQRLSYAYRLATLQPPQPDAEAALVDNFHQHLDHYRTNRQAALELVSVGESARDETLDITELASYTMMANLILNLDRTINKE